MIYNSSMNDRPDISHSARASALAAELRSVAGKLKRRLQEQSSVGDLTSSQIAVLLRLEKEGPATASNLARAEGMRPQSMGSVIAPLEAAGLLSGTADPNDGRQTLLSLTEACRKLIQEGRAARQDWLSRSIAEKFSARDQERLASAIELLKRLVED
jgi:DNA-binding MarR family transcriptional regulator